MVRRQRYGAETQPIGSEIVVRCFLKGVPGSKTALGGKQKLETPKKHTNRLKIYQTYSLYIPYISPGMGSLYIP